MTSDITILESKVIAIQGNAISAEFPTDGYVLTWNATEDGYWEPKPIQSNSSGLRSVSFISDGYWTCPPDVTSILVIGAGGGGGGCGGRTVTNCGGGGGGAALQQTSYVTVTPSTTYTIIVGAGGAGSAGEIFSTNIGVSPGADGQSTKIIESSNVLFYTIGGGGAPGNTTSNYGLFGMIAGILQPEINPDAITKLPGFGGGATGSGLLQGNINYIGGYIGGNIGTNFGGGGGGAGPKGPGANGGNGSTGGNASNGSSANANSASGGGGGGNGNSVGNGGNGGTGGSGYLTLIY